MIVNKVIKQFINQLFSEETAQIHLGDSELSVHIFENAQKISLSCVVYDGENFIPFSVRNSLIKQHGSAHSSLKTHFTIDEDHYNIQLKYVGHLEGFNQCAFVDLLEEFSSIADEWRHFLDDQGNRDLIYIHAPK